MEEVDLKNFEVVRNENGIVFIDKTNVMLQNATTGEVLTTAFDNVSSFYGLEGNSSDGHTSAIEDNNYQEYSPEVSLKDEKPDEESSDGEEVQTPEETPSAPYRPPIKWGQEETKFMLKLYTNLINHVGQNKKFRTKKLMWTHIATLTQRKFKMPLNATQVESRYKCVAKRTKKPLMMIPIINKKKVREGIVYGNQIFPNVEQDDPIGIETVMSQGRIFMMPRKPVVSVPPPAPSTLLKMMPPPPEQDEEIIQEADATGTVRRIRKAPQVIMFEKYLEQKAQFYEKREAKTDQRIRQKAEREKEKQKLKQEKDKDKIEREKQKELMKQRRHLEKMKLLKDILNKSFSN